jgi:hypothetical protein
MFGEGGLEFGYRILMKIAVYFGLSYEVFLAILTACSYLLSHSKVKGYSDSIKGKSSQKILFNISIIIYIIFFIYELYFPYKEVVIDTILKNNLYMGR